MTRIAVFLASVAAMVDLPGPRPVQFSREMPALFAAYGFPFLELVDIRSVLCGERAFSRKDGGHPNAAACSRRIRRRLDAAARRIPLR